MFVNQNKLLNVILFLSWVMGPWGCAALGSQGLEAKRPWGHRPWGHGPWGHGALAPWVMGLEVMGAMVHRANNAILFNSNFSKSNLYNA